MTGVPRNLSVDKLEGHLQWMPLSNCPDLCLVSLNPPICPARKTVREGDIVFHLMEELRYLFKVT